MKEIVYIIDNFKVAGAQGHLFKLVSALTTKNYSLQIVSLGANDENLIKDIIVPVTNLKMDCIWKLSFWLDFFRLINFLSKRKPSIVHTYLNTSNVFGVLAAKIAHVPIIISSRRDLGQFRSGIIGFLERFTARLSDKVVCVSEAARKHCVEREGIPAHKTEVIYNGVEVSNFLKLKADDRKLTTEDSYVVGIIATMDRVEKGHREFIEAASLVLKVISSIEFLLIGDGPLRNSLQSIVHSLQLDEKIKFLGKRNDIAELLLTMDISVNASYSEGMSNTILESMAVGVPVVATAVDGNLETVIDGQTGILVPVKEPKAMAQEIIKILSDKELAKQMGHNARKLVEEKFTLEQMVQNYIELYDKLVIAKEDNPRSSLPASALWRVCSSVSNLCPSVSSNSRQFALDSRKSVFKVGYVVSLFPCWSETFILDEILALTNRGIDINIFSIRKDLEKFTQEKAKPYIKLTIYGNLVKCIAYCVLSIAFRPITIISLFWMVIRSKHKNLKELLKYIWCIFLGAYFSRIAKSHKLSHIHAHFATYPAFTALVISKLTRIPFTFTAHAHDIFLEKPLLKNVTQEAKAVVAISDYNRNYIADYCSNGVASKIRVIHCGIDLNDFNQTIKTGVNRKKTIVSIGRLTKMKGFEYLIRALHKIKDKINFECHIIGEGPLKSALQKLINNLGMQELIFLEGVKDSKSVKAILKQSDLLVVPSIWSDKDGQDGIPVALMEAMASGIPVIASNISGIPELVIDRETGLLVEPKNEQVLAEKMLEVLTDKELQSRLAVAGRRKIETEFNIDKSVGQLVQLFRC